MAKAESINLKNAWNSVALEERLELVSRAQAEGIIAAMASIFLIGSIAYGFDEIWLLGGGLIASLLVMPLFASYSWRKNKPAAVLSYLAVRSVARRYAFGFNISDLSIILIFRGILEERYENQETEMAIRQHESVEYDQSSGTQKPVWICLMRGGFVALSEKTGGAKLEFVGAVDPNLVCRKPTPQENAPERSVVIQGTGSYRGRKVIISSNYPGALYVFEKQLGRLIDEAVEAFKNDPLSMLPDF